INFFRNYSCYGEWASYNQMVLLSGSFGDWATPKRSTAGHFLAPHSCMPAPISERSPHQALLVRTRSPTQALHSLLPSAVLRTAKPRWSGPYTPSCMPIEPCSARGTIGGDYGTHFD